MILLDTNALIWLEAGHPRAKKLAKTSAALAISPASLLELQFLAELGRLRLKHSSVITELSDDERWVVDEPSAAAWFESARSLSWTRDPFDRLIVAHAIMRGWKLATGDALLIDNLGPRMTFSL